MPVPAITAADPNNVDLSEMPAPPEPEQAEEQPEQAASEEAPAEQPAEEAPAAEEAAPAEEPKKDEPPKPTPKMSKALEAAAASERKHRQEAVRLKQAEQALRQRAAGLESRFKEMEAELELATTNPFAFFEKKGVSPNALAKAFMDHKEPTEAEKAIRAAEEAKQKIAAMEKAQAERERRNAEAAEQQRIAMFRQETTDYVSSNEERWPFLNKFGGQAFVAEHVLDHRRRFGTILDVDVAADQAEKQIEEKVVAASKTKKFSSLFTAVPKPPAAPAKPKATSLTNNVTPGPGAQKRPDLSEDERVKRAMDALTFGD